MATFGCNHRRYNGSCSLLSFWGESDQDIYTSFEMSHCANWRTLATFCYYLAAIDQGNCGFHISKHLFGPPLYVCPRLRSTTVQVQVAPNALTLQPSNSGMTVTIAVQPSAQSLPAPQPHMSNRAHRKWILDLLEELDVDDNHEDDSDYGSESDDDPDDPTAEVERRMTQHFREHPELCRQYRHPSQNVPCILCDCKPFRSVGDVYMHAAKTRTKPTAHRGLAAAISWLHDGKEPPRQ